MLNMAFAAMASQAEISSRVASGDLTGLDRDRPFPNFSQLRFIGRDYLPMLATVTFCSVLQGQGTADPGNVASNKEDLVNRIREDVFDSAFPTPDRRLQFRELVKRLNRIRNQIVAHVAGEAAEMSHGGEMELGRYNMATGPSEPDFRLLHQLAQDLRSAIHRHPAYKLP